LRWVILNRKLQLNAYGYSLFYQGSIEFSGVGY